ncbi:MAG: DNA translocase FtsK, partial [Variovorax sp.]
MTYSLNTLQSSSAADAQPVRLRAMRFAHEITLIAGFVVLLFWLLAMLSYTPSDAAWSTSGTGGEVKNWGGRLGAWIADGSYFLAGYSVWWCFAAGVRVWLSSLAGWLRGGEANATDAPQLGRFNRSRVAFWFGLLLLLAASAMLEWSRLYRLEFRLPGHGGGVLGYFVGPLSVKWIGFTGSALIAIAAGVIGSALVFRFSWTQLAERIGSRVYSLFESRREKREIAEDIALGKQAVRERRELTSDERELQPDGVESADEELRIEPRPKRRAASPPVQIEPALTEVPKSDRVAKERQKPLFRELPDSKLPQVDLLDAALARQETVSPDTLEMTSRMIEKKLKDFGVEVRVVLASPGPVITRYEIEPATGVKGSQIVGLAKDLARSLSLVSIRVVETIPGKNYMALELPNAKRQSIKLSEILGSQVYNEGKSFLTMGLGKDIIGNPIVADLAKMPHVLVAGTTGSGKSVG